ncbi:hypothetical protein GQF61_14230 [Sphingobacterium sp. DK4209]|uniref:DUF4136 domain-containing protein n=1 Tax=Sphingobacterium zhuxiongii TaxID=2662364 RepID=A0A5Q0Q781_9SPHI|nr:MULTISPECIES: hypothetical protein [unclassified Sphingobacterium]MVZ67015.1 hypothetical protein [Sphingobacterium sp. DK4209]QGA25925.1 hypothetical protein GFH32_06170 [Sphingobacterium sp. dk4302]
MKKLALLIIFTCLICVAFAQQGRYDTDIFGNLTFQSDRNSYEAKLEKNIFGDLIFTDSRRNKESMDSKFLEEFMPGIQDSKERQQKLFHDLIWQHRHNESYEVSYSVDIFGSVISKDNRGNERESGTDIFGHDFVKDKRKGSTASMKRNIHGDLEYAEDGQTATIKKDIFDKWSYSDSYGNKLEFAPSTWRRLMKKLGSDKEILWYFVDQFFDN